MKSILACELKVGNLVDLEVDPFYDRLSDVDKVIAESELYTVYEIVHDEPGKVGVGYEGIGGIFYYDVNQSIMVDETIIPIDDEFE